MRQFVAAVVLVIPLLAQADAAGDLQVLIDEHWDWLMQQHPEIRTNRGDHSANDRWTDMSLSAHFERDARRGEFLDRLAALDTGVLSAAARLNHRMLTRRLSEARRSHELGLHLMSMDMRRGPQYRYTILEYTPMETERDYRNWLSRLRGLPTLLQQYIELLDEGIAAERVQARAIM